MEEQEIFSMQPSYRSFGGWFLFSGLTILVGIGIILFPICLLAAWITVKSTTYRLTNERLFLQNGFIAKNVQELELYRVQDVSVDQSVIQRIFGVGNIKITSVDKSSPQTLIKGIISPGAVKEQIRLAYRAARKTEGVRTAENIF